MADRKVTLKDLGDAVKLDKPTPATPAQEQLLPADPLTRQPTAAAEPTTTLRQSPVRRTRKQPPSGHIRYDELDRKEARLRPDQYGRLSDASRRLNRARAGQGDRITENTLIRVAIDLLLAREDELTGTTETELRKSVGL